MRIGRIWILFIICKSLADAGELERLRVEGTNIVDSGGRVVSMRGINFGGWLMMETWIPSLDLEWHDHLPRLAQEAGIENEFKQALAETGEFLDDTMNVYTYLAQLHQTLSTLADPESFTRYMKRFLQESPVYDAKSLDRIARRRFGDYGAAQIWNTFHDTWITERDFQLAKAMGFNFVRIPFDYRWFEQDEQPYQYVDYGFRYLDRAMQWAKAHRLYVMLDFHGAPGGQSPWDHTGELSRAEFFKNEEFQRRTAKLWQAIAERYRHESILFAYNVLNEPFSASDQADWIDAHDQMYRAIRSVDPHPIIVMEDGYKLEEPDYKNGFFPLPSDLQWTNIAYSIHFYETGEMERHERKLNEILRIGTMEQQRCKVPIYIGEFNTYETPSEISVQAMKSWITTFNRKGWHWSPWTFKFTNGLRIDSTWGIYNYNGDYDMPRIHHDSLDGLLNKIKRLASEHFVLHEPYAGILRECLVQPVHAAE